MHTPESLIEHYKAVRHRIKTAKFVPRAIPAPKIDVCSIRPVPEPKPNEAAALAQAFPPVEVAVAAPPPSEPVVDFFS